MSRPTFRPEITAYARRSMPRSQKELLAHLYDQPVQKRRAKLEQERKERQQRIDLIEYGLDPDEFEFASDAEQEELEEERAPHTRGLEDIDDPEDDRNASIVVKRKEREEDFIPRVGDGRIQVKDFNQKYRQWMARLDNRKELNDKFKQQLKEKEGIQDKPHIDENSRSIIQTKKEQSGRSSAVWEKLHTKDTVAAKGHRYDYSPTHRSAEASPSPVVDIRGYHGSNSSIRCITPRTEATQDLSVHSSIKSPSTDRSDLVVKQKELVKERSRMRRVNPEAVHHQGSNNGYGGVSEEMRREQKQGYAPRHGPEETPIALPVRTTDNMTIVMSQAAAPEPAPRAPPKPMYNLQQTVLSQDSLALSATTYESSTQQSTVTAPSRQSGGYPPSAPTPTTAAPTPAQRPPVQQPQSQPQTALAQPQYKTEPKQQVVYYEQAAAQPAPQAQPAPARQVTQAQYQPQAQPPQAQQQPVQYQGQHQPQQATHYVVYETVEEEYPETSFA